MRSILNIFCLLLFPLVLVGQEIDIVPALKEIEKGNITEARTLLRNFLLQSPNDPSVMFLDAVLTSDGNNAINKYEAIYKNSPNCKYADAALYRIFSYYYSLGIYNKATSYLDELKSSYPNSPYIKAADRTMPDDEILVEQSAEETSKPKVVSEPKIQTPTEEKNGDILVQAGAFLNLNNAKNLQTQIESDGYKTSLNAKEVGGSVLNVVVIENLQNQTEAEKILEYLKSKFKLSGRIISSAN